MHITYRHCGGGAVYVCGVYIKQHISVCQGSGISYITPDLSSKKMYS